MKINPLIAYITGTTAIIWGDALLLPAAVALFSDEKTLPAFLAAAAMVFAVGFFLKEKGRAARRRVNMREAAYTLAALWSLAALVGMLPTFLSGELNFFDALFLSVSYISTTGINILPTDSPSSLRWWCVISAWLGAASYLVLFVTFLPQAAGVFGVDLAFRRSYGFSPMLGQMKVYAKQMFGVFIALTAVGCLLYFLAGLPPGDAVAAAMLTVSTTGGEEENFLRVVGNPWVKTVAVILILAVSGNMLRLFRTLRRREFSDIYRHAENRFYLSAVAAVSLIVTFQLIVYDRVNFFSALHLAMFETLSFLSTGCFAADDLSAWPDISKMCLLLLMFIGGCMGSPTGGIKMMRVIVLVKMLLAEARRTLHPHMTANVVVDDRSVDFAAVERILAFFFLYLAAFLLFILLLSLGNDQSLSATVAMAAACFTHGGTGLGLYNPSAFVELSSYGKAVCAFFMIAARMEIFALLIIARDALIEKHDKW